MTDDKDLWIDSALDIASEAISEGDSVAMMRVSRALLRYHAESEQELAAARAVVEAVGHARIYWASTGQLYLQPDSEGMLDPCAAMIQAVVAAYDKLRAKESP